MTAPTGHSTRVVKDAPTDPAERFAALDWNDVIDICKEMEAGSCKMGSYGVHGDAQRESLRLIEEAKEYARAAKADNAEVPTHLWDDQVAASDVPKGQKDQALSGF